MLMFDLKQKKKARHCGKSIKCIKKNKADMIRVIIVLYMFFIYLYRLQSPNIVHKKNLKAPLSINTIFS